MRIEASSDGPCQYQNMVNPTTGSQGVSSQSCCLDIKMKGNRMFFCPLQRPAGRNGGWSQGCSLIRC